MRSNVRNNRCSILTWSNVSLIAIASISILACFAFSEVESSCSQTRHLLPSNISFFLHGFAPVIGLLILNGILAHLFVSLVLSLEKTLLLQDVCSVPKPDRKKRRSILSDDLIPFALCYLSLKEHSPPAVSSFPI
jgi:hypothetical protein